METNSMLVDEYINKAQSNLDECKGANDECLKKILYSEAYSSRSK